jgi:hypothetical protein
MTIGPGRYDEICTIVREDTSADLAIVIIVGGKNGDGFSCQTIDPMIMERIPEMLETVAEQIRKDTA